MTNLTTNKSRVILRLNFQAFSLQVYKAIALNLLTGSSVEVLAKVILIPCPLSPPDSLCLATAIGLSAEPGKEGLGSTLGLWVGIQ